MIRRCLAVFAILAALACGTVHAAEPEPAAPTAAASTEPAPDATGDERPDVWQRLAKGFSLHKPNYVLPLTWGNEAKAAEDAELKFQFSFKQRIFATNFFLAYTQKSFWRLLDQEDSRPFRETNYNPELFYRLPPRQTFWGAWGGDLGFEHESNGASEPTSRSWNRLYVAPYVEWENGLRAELKLWHRLSEEVKKTPDDPRGDENPDIAEFYGYGELRLAWLFPNRHQAALMGRLNPATGKGGMQFDYSLPLDGGNVFLLGQLWTGYGESLIDYNRSLTRYGIGLMFKR